VNKTFSYTHCEFGVATRDVTPPVGIYARSWGAATHDVAEGVHRPFAATAAVFAPVDGDEPTLALVAVDLGWFQHIPDERALRATILERTGLDDEALLINMSHTHAGANINSELADKPGGELIREFGGFGKKPGQFVYPTDVAFDSRGRVFVAEYGDNDRVQVFDRESGKFLFQFGKFGNGDGEFSRPQSMVILGDTVYITDASNHRISVWTTEGRFLRNMCKIGSGDGELRFPYGLDVDSKGRLVVCEFGNNRVQLIDKETGRGLGTWGAGGRELGQLAYPWAVAVDKDDRVVAVDAGNNRLQVFEF